jgi:glycosyltransferase involved in cell wall biosynthesis
MKVVHLFKDYFPPTTGGIEQHMRVLCSGLAKTCDVTVLVPSRSLHRREDVVDGVRVVRVPEWGRYAAVPFCPTMPRALARLAPDIVHLHFPNPMGDLAWLLGTRRVPLVISYHADVIRQRRLLPLYTPILTRTFGAARRILVAAPDNIASSPVLPRYKDRCTVIPYGIDLDAFTLREHEAEVVVARRAAFGPDPLILFVGVLRPYKGLDILLKALVRVRANLVVVGRGPARFDLSGLAARLGLSNRVAFLGEVSEAERRILLHACDAFVLPSIDNREAFGIAQLEAMACGKPVIGTDLPTGVRYVNKHQVTGLLVPPGDVEALATALHRLLGDARLRATLGNAAQGRARLEFSADIMVRRVMQVYEEVLGGRR